MMMPDLVVANTPKGIPASPSGFGTLPRVRRRVRLAAGESPLAAANGETTPPLSNSVPNGSGSGSGQLVSQNSQKSFIRTCLKAKRVRFYRNGDQFFKGLWYAISSERFRCFEALLEELTKSLDDLINLPHGVRYIFTLDGRTKLQTLEEFQDGEGYVCASNELFKRVDYENAKEPIWSYSISKPRRHDENYLLKQDWTVDVEPNDFVQPRIVTIIRNGVKPRRVVRMLLNKKTAHSYNQVIADITTAVKLDSGAVKRLFTLDGTQISSLGDFFKDDYIFIAYGSERLSIDDFYLDSEEYKFLYSPKWRPLSAAFSAFCSHFNKSSQKLWRKFGVPIQPTRNPADLNPSPVLRRKFLNQRQRNQKKLKPNKPRSTQENDSPVFTERITDDLSEASNHPAEILEQFSVGRLLGDGNFANVYDCVCRRTGQPVALKVIDKGKCVGKEEMVDGEVRLLRRVNHPHIVKFLSHWDTANHHYLAMELVRGGDLFDTLVAVRQLQESEASQLLRCLSDALDYLHNHNIVHRDVKPENLLVYETSDGMKQLKLADFGLAAEASEVLYTICGTPTYVAPEILQELGYGLKVDVWASGVILFIMLCGFPPFVSVKNSQEELFEQILSGRYSFPSPYWDHISNSAKSLIKGMLQLDADERLSASEVLMHPWITCGGNVSDNPGEFPSDTASTNNLMRKPSDFAHSVEFYFTRRRSMDDLSSRANSSFHEFSFESHHHIAAVLSETDPVEE